MKSEWEKRRNISSANITRTVRYLYAKGLATKKKPTSKVLSISFSLFSSHEDEEWRTKSAAKKSHDYTHTHTPNEKIKVEMQWKKVMAFINIRTVFTLSISLSRSLFLFIAFFCPSETKLNKQMKKRSFIHTIELLVPNTFLMIQLSTFRTDFSLSLFHCRVSLLTVFPFKLST